MTSPKFWDFFDPLPPPLSLSHSRNLSVQSSAIGGPPSPSQCRHHMYMAPNRKEWTLPSLEHNSKVDGETVHPVRTHRAELKAGVEVELFRG